ncbi:MAG: hypothetical protein WD426_09165 [Anditalea sp.]
MKNVNDLDKELRETAERIREKIVFLENKNPLPEERIKKGRNYLHQIENALAMLRSGQPTAARMWLRDLREDGLKIKTEYEEETDPRLRPRLGF